MLEDHNDHLDSMARPQLRSVHDRKILPLLDSQVERNCVFIPKILSSVLLHG